MPTISIFCRVSWFNAPNYCRWCHYKLAKRLRNQYECRWACLLSCNLTLKVLKPEYFGQTRLIPWWLTHCLLYHWDISCCNVDCIILDLNFHRAGFQLSAPTQFLDMQIWIYVSPSNPARHGLNHYSLIMPSDAYHGNFIRIIGTIYTQFQKIIPTQLGNFCVFGETFLVFKNVYNISIS